jgi:hypothetical protein
MGKCEGMYLPCSEFVSSTSRPRVGANKYEEWDDSPRILARSKDTNSKQGVWHAQRDHSSQVFAHTNSNSGRPHKIRCSGVQRRDLRLNAKVNSFDHASPSLHLYDVPRNRPRECISAPMSFPCSSADELLFHFVTGAPKTLLHDRWFDRLDCALAVLQAVIGNPRRRTTSRRRRHQQRSSAAKVTTRY